jgi:tetratricopeptide (TPR) repeat protein
MLAEQPSRHQRAVQALHDLADKVRQRGGHRLALVVFAAHAKVICPLTHDYDHFRAAVTRLDPVHLPPALRPQADGPDSGTRIGEALRLAVQIHDPRFPGNQDILLLSDGDDPGADNEWADGAGAAARSRIPVYAIGVGDPEKAFPIPAGKGFLRHGGKEVQTQLQEEPLQKIAQRTRGLYIPARTRTLPLCQWLRDVIEPRQAWREDDEDVLPTPQSRYALFFGAALALLGVCTCAGSLRGRRGSKGQQRTTQSAVRNNQKLPALSAGLAALVALLLLAAAPLPAGLDLLRHGNDAYHDENFKQALEDYTRAEAAVTDPGLVAFNKAAALFRLGLFDKAEYHYRCCLDDAEGQRRAQALYGQGNCLLQLAGTRDARMLERAIACYRDCRRVPEATVSLRADAGHNLELARLLWLKARKDSPAPPENDPEKTDPMPEKKHDDGKGESGERKNPEGPQGAEPGKGKQGAEESTGTEQKRPAAGRGDLRPLPDTEELVPLPPEDASAYLERLAQRIRRERRDYWQGAAPAVPNVKDW